MRINGQIYRIYNAGMGRVDRYWGYANSKRAWAGRFFHSPDHMWDPWEDDGYGY